MKKILTLDQLNELQADWVAFDISAPARERDAICKRMEDYPRRFIAESEGGGFVVFCDGPVNGRYSLKEARDLMVQWKGRADVYWDARRGLWRDIKSAVDNA